MRASRSCVSFPTGPSWLTSAAMAKSSTGRCACAHVCVHAAVRVRARVHTCMHACACMRPRTPACAPALALAHAFARVRVRLHVRQLGVGVGVGAWGGVRAPCICSRTPVCARDRPADARSASPARLQSAIVLRATLISGGPSVMACAPSYEIAGVPLGVEARNDFDLCYPFGHMGIRPVECMLGHMRGRSEDTQSVSSDPTVPTVVCSRFTCPSSFSCRSMMPSPPFLDIMPCARSDHSVVCAGTVASVGKLWTTRSAFYSVGQASRM
jgi:hypothetical protein